MAKKVLPDRRRTSGMAPSRRVGIGVLPNPGFLVEDVLLTETGDDLLLEDGTTLVVDA